MSSNSPDSSPSSATPHFNYDSVACFTIPSTVPDGGYATTSRRPSSKVTAVIALLSGLCISLAHSKASFRSFSITFAKTPSSELIFAQFLEFRKTMMRFGFGLDTLKLDLRMVSSNVESMRYLMETVIGCCPNLKTLEMHHADVLDGSYYLLVPTPLPWVVRDGLWFKIVNGLLGTMVGRGAASSTRIAGWARERIVGHRLHGVDVPLREPDKEGGGHGSEDMAFSAMYCEEHGLERGPLSDSELRHLSALCADDSLARYRSDLTQTSEIKAACSFSELRQFKFHSSFLYHPDPIFVRLRYQLLTLPSLEVLSIADDLQMADDWKIILPSILLPNLSELYLSDSVSMLLDDLILFLTRHPRLRKLKLGDGITRKVQRRQTAQPTATQQNHAWGPILPLESTPLFLLPNLEELDAGIVMIRWLLTPSSRNWMKRKPLPRLKKITLAYTLMYNHRFSMQDLQTFDVDVDRRIHTLLKPQPPSKPHSSLDTDWGLQIDFKISFSHMPYLAWHSIHSLPELDEYTPILVPFRFARTILFSLTNQLLLPLNPRPGEASTLFPQWLNQFPDVRVLVVDSGSYREGEVRLKMGGVIAKRLREADNETVEEIMINGEKRLVDDWLLSR